MIRIAIADDDGLSCEGLRAMLAAFADLPVVGCVAGVGVEPLVEAHHPDVLLVASHMAGVLDLCERMRRRGRPLPILLSVDGDDEWAARALEAGARGVLLRSAGLATLERAIRAVHDGQIWAPQVALDRVVEDAACGREDREALRRRAIDRLSGREQDVLRHAARGLSNKEIAASLCVRPATVKAHLTHVFQKLGLRDRLQLAVRYGASFPPESPASSDPAVAAATGGTPPRGLRRPT